MTHHKLRIGFAGTPEFGLPTLQALTDSRHSIAVVYSQPDRPAGRGRKLTASPVKQFALAHGIPVEQPASLRDEEAATTVKSYRLDLLVVAAYGLILPEAILQVPAMGCWNVHASLLPRWRGAAPIQRAILAGDDETGVCIMQMNAGLDTGDMLVRHATMIDENETAGNLHDRLAELGAASLIECIAHREQLRPEPQDNSRATYAEKLTKSEAKLSWNDSAASIVRKIQAFNPWPGAQVEVAGDTLKAWQATYCERMGPPGEVLTASGSELLIAAAEGSVSLHSVQRPGGRAVSAQQYLHGRTDLRV